MTALATPAVAQRPRWRSVAVPNEHGGWGLTAEPVLLGLLLAPSPAGGCIGLAAVIAFLVRTPLKLVSIDVRHRRSVDRTRLAVRIAAVEVIVLALLGISAVALAGWSWTLPIAAAAPLVAIEWSFDSRGRGRRLVPELAGAVGIAAAAAAIVVADDGSWMLAVGVWLVITGRAVGSIPFVRVQISRLRRGTGDVHQTDVAQLVAVLLAAVAVAVDTDLLAGAVGVVVLAVLQSRWVRRPPVPARRLGLTQLGLGLSLVVLTAAGVLVR
ncbi:MAG: YwiC-like family protein [Ilumatobacteraceae bacterium]